jgi:hypothetical protein
MQRNHASNSTLGAMFSQDHMASPLADLDESQALQGVNRLCA